MAEVVDAGARPVRAHGRVPERDDAGPRHDRRPLLRVLGVATAFYAVFIWRTSWVAAGQRRFTLFDDAMISMSYARTFASGDGLVWYPGAPHVEGFTNPLWVLIMAGLHRIGLSASGVALVVMVLGAALCLGAALLAVAVVRQLTHTTPGFEAAVGGLVALCYPLVYWSLRGMEVGLVTVLTLASAWLALRLDPGATGRRAAAGRSGRTATTAWLCIVLAAGVTTRLDFAVVAAVTIAWLGWRAPRGRGIALVAPLVGTVVAALVAQELLRQSYYGAWTPNTYTLKTAGVPLVDRLTRGGWVALATTVGFVLASAVVLVLAARRRGLCRPSGTALPVAVGLALLGYSTLVGGDAWEWMVHPNRYLVPGVVLAMVAAAAAAADLLRTRPERDGTLVRSLSAAGVAAMVGPWVAFALLAASGIGAKARVTVDAGEVALIVLGVAVVTVFLTRRLAGAVRSAPAASAATLTVVVLAVGANLLPGLQWVGDGGAYRSVDQRAADVGLVLHEITRPGARIAVVGAGNPIYFSERAGVDLLGKSDAHIAALPSRAPFTPGHTKWDYRYSIVEQRPDVITQLFHPTPDDFALVAAAGYELMTVRQDVAPFVMVLLVRDDSRLVDRSRLEPASEQVRAAFFSS